ncbi:MAG: alpha/beta hydrolase [Methylococcales bacterium]|jgi:alpha-beta hydrolase superfamily lysophospholipase|nr:alpha/beta hydrolase [Methylococcales bacterium]
MLLQLQKPFVFMSLLMLVLTTAAFYYISYNFSWSFKPPKTAMKVQKNISDALLTKTAFISNDGYQHPLKIWRAKNGNHKAIVVCLHGFNDYSSSFASLGKYLSTQDIKTIAYDQRGFGGTNSPGYWHGGSVMADDLFSLVALIKSKEQNMPIFVLGSSMGGGVVLKTLSSTLLDVNGVILVAPSVRGRTVMPWYQRATLWLAAHTIPWAQIGGGGLKITPSDNKPMLQDLRKDPLIIKKTIIATVWGLVNLMDDALLASNELNANTLLLYGKKDEVIPPVAMKKMIDSLPVKGTHIQKIIYDEGYHMLLRDLQGWLVQSDINLWIHNILVADSSPVVKNHQVL